MKKAILLTILMAHALTAALSAQELCDYYGLTATQKKLYNQIVAGVENLDIRIEVDAKPETAEELKAFNDVFIIVRETHPEFFYLGNKAQTGKTGDKTWVWPVYVVDTVEVSVTIADGRVRYPTEDYMAKVKAVVEKRKAAVRDKLNDLPVHKGMTPYEIELAVHDWLYKQVAYNNETTNKNTIYGALVEGIANCQGISRAFQYILDTMGIECLLLGGPFVDGAGNEGPHQWNAVKLDSQWYQVDISSNVTGGKSNGLQHYHIYFNRTDAVMALNHTIDTQAPFPKITCKATTYDYFRKNGLYIVSDDDFIKKMPAIITKARANKDTMIELEFAKEYTSANNILTKMKLIDASYSEGVNFMFMDLFGSVFGVFE